MVIFNSTSRCNGYLDVRLLKSYVVLHFFCQCFNIRKRKVNLLSLIGRRTHNTSTVFTLLQFLQFQDFDYNRPVGSLQPQDVLLQLTPHLSYSVPRTPYISQLSFTITTVSAIIFVITFLHVWSFSFPIGGLSLLTVVLFLQPCPG